MWSCYSPRATGDIWALQKLLPTRCICSLHICPCSIPVPSSCSRRRAPFSCTPSCMQQQVGRRREGLWQLCLWHGRNSHISLRKRLRFFPKTLKPSAEQGCGPLTSLCITCLCEAASVGATLQCNIVALSHPLPHRAAALWGLTSPFPDSSTSHHYQLAQHTSPFAFEVYIWYFRLEVWVVCARYVGSSSSINVTEEAVSSWNLSHFHSQNTTGPAVPLLNIFYPFFWFSCFFQSVS